MLLAGITLEEADPNQGHTGGNASSEAVPAALWWVCLSVWKHSSENKIFFP